MKTSTFLGWVYVFVIVAASLYILAYCSFEANAQVGQPLWEDQFYDPTSYRDPVEVKMQEDTKEFFDNLNRLDETVTGSSLDPYESRYDLPAVYQMEDDRSQE